YACGLAEHDTPGHRSILTRRVISPSDLLRRGRWTWRSSLRVTSRCRGRHCIFVCLCRICGIHCIFFCRIRSHFFLLFFVIHSSLVSMLCCIAIRLRSLLFLLAMLFFIESLLYAAVL